MDVFAFRIVTDKVDTCYRILGAVHHLNLYRPVPGRFKDYIAIPKSNGYQSIHTTLYRAGSGVHTPIEIQIRTEEMDAIANYGVADHWLYKTPIHVLSGPIITLKNGSKSWSTCKNAPVMQWNLSIM